LKTYYDLLGIEANAHADEVKRAFRREIARYHPDKVQHLGPEFQEIAATRAAELTEAYRILMDPPARADYDARMDSGGASAAHRPASPSQRPQPTPPPATSGPARGSAPDRDADIPDTLRKTRATMSQFMKKATIGRLREAVDALAGSAEPLAIDGFDAAYVLRPRRGILQRAEPPVNLLCRVVATVDGAAVEDAWPLAVRAGGPDRMVCLLLLGHGLAPARELAAKIAEQRRRTRQVAPVVVPVDTRDWTALLPPETPSAVRKLLDRLKLGG
jgi:hypothetical protein